MGENTHIESVLLREEQGISEEIAHKLGFARAIVYTRVKPWFRRDT